VYVDSSAYLAVLDRADRHHADAQSILAWLARERYRQYTTNVLLVECHALILSVRGSREANEFLRGIYRSNTTIIRARAGDEERAREILFCYADKAFSYNDAISFTVMERLGLQIAFTFDGDFAQYGFAVLRPDQG
jgi:uncharacterized protein